MTYGQAVQAYEVPKSTIEDRIKNLTKYSKLGRAAVLTGDVESPSVHAINKLADWGFGVSDKELKQIIRGYLDGTKQNLFNNNLPGRKFFILFRQRHQKMFASRIAQNLAANRVVDLNNNSFKRRF